LFSTPSELFFAKQGVGGVLRHFSIGLAAKFACISPVQYNRLRPSTPPGANMPINELLINEWDQEGANTRKALERVPAEKWDWKPHPKSGTLGWIASHIATLPNFAVTTIKTSEYEIDSGERPKVDGHSRLLPVFDEQLRQAREALAGVTDEQLRNLDAEMERAGHVCHAQVQRRPHHVFQPYRPPSRAINHVLAHPGYSHSFALWAERR
jgi:hypothetical protein